MAKRPNVLILNGPNLNLLGTREPGIYGRATLKDIEAECHKHGEANGLAIDFRQTNREDELIGWVQEARSSANGIIVNPAGYGHTSIALLDALLAVRLPVIEVHLSNIFARDEFRHHSYVSRAARGVICGLGPLGYRLAITSMAELLKSEAEI